MRTISVLFSLCLAASAFAAADLQFFSAAPQLFEVFEPGSRVTYRWFVYNFGDAIAVSPTLTMTLPAGARFIGATPLFTNATCSETSGVVTCNFASVPPMPDTPRTPVSVAFDIFAPNSGGAFETTATLTSASIPAPLTVKTLLNVFRDFTVTSNADSGPGTLRQAIVDSNAVCTDTATCRVHFNLGASPATIAPLSPLPVITSTNAVYATDMPINTPLDTPRKVTIDGSHLKTGDGIVVTSNGFVTIHGLAVQNFPWNGIFALDQGFTKIDLCFVDNNGLRGVAAYTRGGVNVTGSAIRGNRRSGVYIGAGSNSGVSGCTITGNGASGIFTSSNGLLVSNNTIAHNNDFGVAIARSIVFVTIFENSIFDNGVLAIDRGLDLQNVNDPTMPNAPVITDATYDAASNKTIITARWDPTPEQIASFGRFAQTYVFANTNGRPDAEKVISHTLLGPGQSMTVSVSGDYRGQIITALVDVYRFGDDIFPESSELSNGVTVH